MTQNQHNVPLSEWLFLRVPVTIACGCLYALCLAYVSAALYYQSVIGLLIGLPWWGFGLFLATILLREVWVGDV